MRWLHRRVPRRSVLIGAVGLAGAAVIEPPAGAGLISIAGRTVRPSSSGASEDSWWTGDYNGLTPDFYISTSGDDDNDGLTPDTAWALTALNKSAHRSSYAGKVIGLVDGTYDVYDLFGAPSVTSGAHAQIVVQGGSEGSPTILVSQTRCGAKLDANWTQIASDNPSLNTETGLIGARTDYVTFDGLWLDDCNYGAVVNYQSSTSANHFTLKNCKITNQSYRTGDNPGANANMFYSQGFSHILIQNCRFEGGDAVSDGHRHAQIQTYQTTDDCVIEYCTFTSVSGTGNAIHFKQGGNTQCIVRNCYIDRSNSDSSDNASIYESCIFFDGTNNDESDHFKAYNNVMISGAANGFSCFLNNNMPGSIELYNNTYVGDWHADGCYRNMSGDKSGQSPTQVDSYNNIHWRTTGAGGTYGDAATSTVAAMGTFDYNRYPTSPKFARGSGPSATYNSLSAWQSATSKEANSTTGDPKFVAEGTEAAYYKLQSDSPCKTAGADGGEIGAWRGVTQVGCSFS